MPPLHQAQKPVRLPLPAQTKNPYPTPTMSKYSPRSPSRHLPKMKRKKMKITSPPKQPHSHAFWAVSKPPLLLPRRKCRTLIQGKCIRANRETQALLDHLYLPFWEDRMSFISDCTSLIPIPIQRHHRRRYQRPSSRNRRRRRLGQPHENFQAEETPSRFNIHTNPAPHAQISDNQACVQRGKIGKAQSTKSD